MKLELTSHDNEVPINWFALVSHYDNMQREVYQKISGHLLEPLYLSTPLESLLSRSPLVIALYPNDPLIHALPKENTLYFSAAADTSFDTALAQLRNRLQIQFSGNRKGVFHYYLPSVASYFLSRSDKDETARWLACFTAVYFYRQTLSELPDWLNMQGNGQAQDENIWLLTPSQEHALTDKYDENEIAQWAEAENVSSLNWNKQKRVNTFCAHYHIEQPQQRSRLRQLVQRYDVVLNELNFMPNHQQTSESIVEQLEKWLSREYEYVR